ncbi:MAG: CvpA family protein [Agriterribacter sp.]
MWIDIVFLIILIIAVIKGIRRGIIMALFSFIGWFIGLAAALKLSAVVAVYLQDHTSVNTKWLPLFSFILVFVIVVILVQMAGKALENVFDFTMLGWVNRLGGALLYAGMYTLVFSVVLFYAGKMQLIQASTFNDSKAYALVGGLGPSVIEAVGAIIPVFKNIFLELEHFFENIGKNHSS